MAKMQNGFELDSGERIEFDDLTTQDSAAYTKAESDAKYQLSEIYFGRVVTGQNGSSYRSSGSNLSVFRQSGGASPSSINVYDDELSIINAPANMSTDGVYITVPSDARFIKISGGCYWAATLNAAGQYRLEVGLYSSGSVNSISIIPGQTLYENNTAGTSIGSNVHLVVDTGFQRVGAGEIITANMKIGLRCYHNTGTNLSLNSGASEFNYMRYEVIK